MKGSFLALVLTLALALTRRAVFVVLQSHDGARALVVEHEEFAGRALGPRQGAPERGGAGEHLDHGRARTNIPPRQVAIERLGAFEHSAHALASPDLPARKVPLERFGVVEHANHVLHVRHVPARQVAVEHDGFVEHEAGQ